MLLIFTESLTNDHRCVPFVVSTSWSFPHWGLITRCH